MLSNILTKEFLNKCYIEDKLSMQQISDKVGCCSKTIHQYMKKNGIERRSAKDFSSLRDFNHNNWNGNNVRDLLTKDFLYREYVELNKSVHQIAKENNIKSSNSVSQFLTKYKLKRKDKKNSASIYSKEFLEEYYVKQNLSLADVAAKAGMKSKSIVKRWLVYHNISIRGVTVSDKMVKSRNRNRGEFFSSKYWDGVHSGATQRDIQLSITKEFAYKLFLSQNEKCAISGVDINLLWDTGERTASLDRINSYGHYTEDNVQWVHKDINQMKMTMSDCELINWCHIISNHHRKRL